MATVIEDDLLVCEECTLIIANGEIDDGREDQGESVALAQVDVWGADAIGLVLTCDAEDNYNGTHDDAWMSPIICDGCNRPMFGEFHAAAVLR